MAVALGQYCPNLYLDMITTFKNALPMVFFPNHSLRSNYASLLEQLQYFYHNHTIDSKT